MIRTAACALLAVLSASPAQATGGIYCDGAQADSVAVTLTIGRVPGLAVVGAVIEADAKVWQYQKAVPGAEEIALAQAARIGDLIVIDFTDANGEEIAASVRVVMAADGDSTAAAGVLTVPGTGTWPLVCEVDGV